MKALYLLAITGTILTTDAVANQVLARSSIAVSESWRGSPTEALPGVLQCVPFARETSGINLYGDAHTWWDQAVGKYSRGHTPRVGAVMAIRPHAGSSLGHVATVSAIRDARTILITHANWSAPGKIERNVTAVDMSPANDWSAVRLWYAPIADLGGKHWPVAGFIYSTKASSMQLASRETTPASATTRPSVTRVKPTKSAKVRFGHEPELAMRNAARASTPRLASQRNAASAKTPTTVARGGPRRDPIGTIIARSL